MSKRITQEQVWKVFAELIQKGKMPTASKIERALNIPYTSSTIYKFLQALKIKAYQALVIVHGSESRLQNNTPSLMSGSSIDVKDDLTKKTTILEQKLKTLTAELIRSEKEVIGLKDQKQTLKNDLKEMTEKYQMLNLKCEHLENLYQQIQAERAEVKKVIATEKDQQILVLQKELCENYRRSLEQIKDLGYAGDEALIQEKVKAVQLEDKLEGLNEKVKSLEAELQMAKDRVQPLIQQIQRQKSFIQTVVTWEQMQEYEALMNKD